MHKDYVYIHVLDIYRSTLLFMIKITCLFVKYIKVVPYSKYAPSKDATFVHLSGKLPISSLKKSLSFEVIHSPNKFSILPKDVNREY